MMTAVLGNHWRCFRAPTLLIWRQRQSRVREVWFPPCRYETRQRTPVWFRWLGSSTLLHRFPRSQAPLGYG
jgi:hypothetical protein